ncbi:FeoA family protein [Pseudaeromonas paramecii]|uniref:FeoA family protein n=1 Tax=Pseudaeromonas paramecii TaxID=2138166 RepID=A0ABP8Q5W8_9GAMM
MLLSELEPGCAVRIGSLAGVEPAVRRKLMVMGLLPHTEVRLLRTAPFGDPLQVAADGITLSLQRALAGQIEVELV